MQAVLNYLKKNQARFVAELCEYVRFASVSAQPKHRQDMQACAQWLAKHCRNIGLEARVCPTDFHPIVVARTPGAGRARHSVRAGVKWQQAARTGLRAPPRKHFLVYGHYDVQPPEPFELWDSPPFEPRIQGRLMFGRGASDNKGQNLAHLKAVEAYLQTGTELPCDLTFVIEGEEEVGGESLADFLKQNRRELACDGVVISDTSLPGKNLPALTCSLRGITALEVTVHGPSRDLHSGVFGGSLENPAMALCGLLAQLRDRNGRITVPGFYDDVRELTPRERRQIARLPFNARSYRNFLGVPQLFGERGYSPNEQRGARPALEINGLTSGYQSEGSKTIIPAWARAKLTCRLVPNQEPAKIARAVANHLRRLCPPTVRLEIEHGHGAEPYWVEAGGERARAALRALKKAFGREPVLLHEGGSIPIVNTFKKTLGADSLLVGLALPDDNAHSPNEKFDLDVFYRGQLMSAHLWRELSGA
jgi:acetylornithine deacetylase/succinyl-diaminopimelate desuccinylase-like protein